MQIRTHNTIRVESTSICHQWHKTDSIVPSLMIATHPFHDLSSPAPSRDDAWEFIHKHEKTYEPKMRSRWLEIEISQISLMSDF